MKKTYFASSLLSGTLAFSASATTLLQIEFNQDDQPDFDLWPTAFAGAESIANFATDPGASSGTTTVTITSNTGFGLPPNRGTIVNGTPPGFTYQNLYADLLIATSPTGALTLDFAGLNANETYQFTLYAWDPGDSRDLVREWTVQTGTGSPASATLNWSDPLVDNETFTMNFDITTDGTGGFSLSDTGFLQGSAINGFTLSQVPEPSSALLVVLGSIGLLARRSR